MTWDDLIIKPTEANFDEILKANWSWLLHGGYRPFVMTAFGDWFLLYEDGSAYLLDLLQGELTPVADSGQELRALMEEEENQELWFMPVFVSAMRRAGKFRGNGQCYGYKIPPMIGGEILVANLALMNLNVWQRICSEIHRQTG